MVLGLCWTLCWTFGSSFYRSRQITLSVVVLLHARKDDGAFKEFFRLVNVREIAEVVVVRAEVGFRFLQDSVVQNAQILPAKIRRNWESDKLRKGLLITFF